MQYHRLGRSDLRVSSFIMGCGNFGGVGSSPEFFGMGENEAEAMALLDRAVDLGLNVLDTADAYGGGRSEETIGAWLRARGPAMRERVLISTKVGNPVGDDLDHSGLSAAHIERQVEASLRRLGVEHIDMYLPHAPDPATPMLETLEAFDAVIAAGKVRAIGVSNHTAAAVAESLELSSGNGLHRFEWVQNSFNLIDQAEQSDTLELCRREGLGFTPFGPLYGGWLTGKYDFEADYPEGSRMTLRPEPYLQYWTRATFDAIHRLGEMAADFGVSTAGLALCWLLHHPDVTAPVVGPRRPEHFDPVFEALALELHADDHHAIGALFLGQVESDA